MGGALWLWWGFAQPTQAVPETVDPTAEVQPVDPTTEPAVPAPAHGVSLEWVAPAGCPTAPEMQEAVERLLGKRLASITGTDLRAVLHVEGTPDASAFNLRLATETPDGSGERRLADSDCRLLADAAALIVALSIDPVAVMDQETQPRPLDPPKPKPDPVVIVQPVPVPQPSTPTGPEVGFAVRLGGGVSVGPLPEAAAGLELAFAVRINRARVELYGVYFFEQSARVAVDVPDFPAEVGGDVLYWAGGVKACPVWGKGALEFPTCAGIELGSMAARGIGVMEQQSPAGSWTAVRVGQAMAWRPEKRLALWLGADAHVPLVRPGFTVRNIAREVHRAAPVGFLGIVGVEARFP